MNTVTVDFVKTEDLRVAAARVFTVPTPTDNDLERVLAWAQVVALRSGGAVHVGWPGAPQQGGAVGVSWWCRITIGSNGSTYTDDGSFMAIEDTLERACLVAFVAASEYIARRDPKKPRPELPQD